MPNQNSVDLPRAAERLTQLAALGALVAQRHVNADEATAHFAGARRDLIVRHLETLALMGEVTLDYVGADWSSLSELFAVRDAGAHPVSPVNDDWFDLLSAMLEPKARFLVVGAHALAAHGIPRGAQDLDVWVDATRVNAERIWDALSSFGAPVQSLRLKRASGRPKDLADLQALGER